MVLKFNATFPGDAHAQERGGEASGRENRAQPAADARTSAPGPYAHEILLLIWVSAFELRRSAL